MQLQTRTVMSDDGNYTATLQEFYNSFGLKRSVNDGTIFITYKELDELIKFLQEIKEDANTSKTTA